MRNKFQIVGDNLVGRGLAFSVAAFDVSKKDFDTALVDVVEAVYRQGRDSVGEKRTQGAVVVAIGGATIVLCRECGHDAAWEVPS